MIIGNGIRRTNMTENKNELSVEQREELLKVLQARFEELKPLLFESNRSLD